MRTTTNIIIACISFALSLSAWSATEQERQAFDLATAAADAAWQRGDWESVRGALDPVVAQPSLPVQWRSIAHLRKARALLVAKQYDAARTELDAIVARQEYPQVHRDEALSLAKEVSRLKQGLPARDPEATRLRLTPAPNPGRLIHVAPDAKPDGDGSEQRPFGSLEQALVARRAAPQAPGGTAVLLAPGRYPVSKGIRLGKEDSGTADAPLVIRAAKPGTAVFYGGAVLKGFQPVEEPDVLRRLPAEAGGKVVQSDLKAHGITDYGTLAVRGFAQGDSPPTLELFANGMAQTLARWPNEGFVKAGKLLDPGDPNGDRPSVFEYTDDRHARWTTAPDAWLSGYFHFLWAGSTLPVGKVDPVAKTLATAQPYRLWGMGMNEQQGIIYHAFNLLEEIDQPGEWYLDRAKGILYWYPAGDPGSAVVEISMLAETMVSAEGTGHLRMEGLVFDCARFNGLEFKDCSDLSLAGCTIRRMAGNGIIIDGGFRNRLVGCDIHTLGRMGSLIRGGDRPTLVPGAHAVVNTRFRDFGRIDRTYTPAIQLEGVGNRVAHCLFENSPSSAMRVEGNDHLIEFNEFRRVVLESDDQGAIDMWNNPSYRGIVFRHNFFHDIGDTGGRHAGQGAIRFDDIICGMTVYGNVFLRAGTGFGGVQMNCGRDNVIDNNLFIDCPIAVNGGYAGWSGAWQNAKAPNPPPEFIFNDLYRTRYPELNRMFEAPFLNYMWRNAIIRCGKEINWPPEAYDRVANAIRSEEPGFLNGRELVRQPTADHFGPLGLRPIPIGEIGLYPDPARAGWDASD